MTLLAPLAAIVAGAAGGGLLLAMYMLRLRRRPVRVSTTMFWGDPPKDLEANVPWRMVRPAWTLLLQALAIALLALALGRPAMNLEGGSSQRVLIVIDASASMGATDGGGGRTRLDAAKARALEIIDGIGGLGGSRAMVIAMGRQAESPTGMTADRGVLAAAVRSIEATDEAGDLESALDLVGTLLASQAGEGDTGGAARVVLLSDGGFDLGVRRPLAGASLEFVPVGEATAAPDNLAIAALAAERAASTPEVVRVFVRVVSTRADTTAATLVFRVDGQEVSRRAVSVPAVEAAVDAGAEGVGAREPEAGRLFALGEASLSLELSRAQGGVLSVEIERADLLASDNRAAVVVPPVERAWIVVVSPGEPDGFLLDVLEEIAPGRVRTLDVSAAQSPAGSELLGLADLIVFDRAALDPLPETPALAFGVGLDADGLRAVVDEGGAVAETGETAAATWDRAHPALADVTLDPLVVSRSIRLEDGARRTLASGAFGALIVEGVGGARRIVVTFALHDSNWPLSVGFAIFVSSAVEHLVYGGSPGRGVALRAGEAVGPSALGGTGGEVTVVDQAGRVVGSGATVVVRRAGVYEVRGGGRSVPVAVNLGDERESRLAVSSSVMVAGEAVAGIEPGPRPVELWHWFVLAAGVVLVAEWLVYVRSARAGASGG